MSLSTETMNFICTACPCSLTGKTVLITGANSGIGFKTAETMVYLGASVILACRNIEKAEAAKAALLAEYPEADVSILQLDLSDFSSIEAFANALPDVDVFVNNAGLLHRPGKQTKQGFDMVMGTNYLGTYYLSELVLPKLSALAHDVTYINTVSIIHKVAHVNYRHFQNGRGAYARSKLCLARYSTHLAEKYHGTNVHVYMNHPGMAVTPIASHMFAKLYRFADKAPINSAEKSSLSVAWILSHDVPDGSLVGPNRGFGGWGYPEINRPARNSRRGIEKLLSYTAGLVSEKTSRF